MLLGLEQRNHNPRVGGSSPSSATISLNIFNALQRLKKDLEAFFYCTPLTHFLFKSPAKFFEPNFVSSDFGKMKKSECGHCPAELVREHVFEELVNFF